MKFLLPPYSRKHIIVLASVTFFIAIGLLFYFKLLPNQNRDSQTSVKQTTAENLKSDFKDQVAKIQEDKDEAAWALDGFIVMDIRPTEDFDKQHIVGATNVPLSGLQIAYLNTDVDMVVYSPNEEDLDKAVAILKAKNIRNVHTLNESLDQLKQSGYKLTEAK